MTTLSEWQAGELDPVLVPLGFRKRGRLYSRVVRGNYQLVSVEAIRSGSFWFPGSTLFQLEVGTASTRVLEGLGQPGKPPDRDHWHWAKSIGPSLPTANRASGEIARRWLERTGLPAADGMTGDDALKRWALDGMYVEATRPPPPDLPGRLLRAVGSSDELARYLGEVEEQIGWQEVERGEGWTPRVMTKRGLDRILALASSNRPRDRWLAANQLSVWRRTDEVIGCLYSLSEDTEGFVRRSAVVALATHGERSVFPVALEMLDAAEGPNAAHLARAVARTADSDDGRRRACEALLRLRQRAVGRDLQGIRLRLEELGCSSGS
jgi:hypothetical protein